MSSLSSAVDNTLRQCQLCPAEIDYFEVELNKTDVRVQINLAKYKQCNSIFETFFSPAFEMFAKSLTDTVDRVVLKDST